MIRLDKIEGKDVAVHVPTEEAARAFYDAMVDSHRSKVASDGMRFFDQYNRQSGFCYYPRFHEERTMSYGTRNTYDEWGVPVVEFEELIMSDLSIDVSDMPIESLFSVG